MYLSRLPLHLMSREVRRDCGNIHEMHRTVLRAFPETEVGSPRQRYGVLWRMEETTTGPVLLVQSEIHPDWTNLPEHYLAGRVQVRSLQPVLSAITAGRELRFRLVANPTASGPPGSAGERGRRTPIRKTEDQVKWLLRQGERHGFAIPGGAEAPELAVTRANYEHGRKHLDSSSALTRISTLRVQFEGRLVVTDPEALRTALRTGIGRAKAYGCGLLSLAAG